MCPKTAYLRQLVRTPILAGQLSAAVISLQHGPKNSLPTCSSS